VYLQAQVNVEIQIAPFNSSPYRLPIGNAGIALCPSISAHCCTHRSSNKEAEVNQLVVTVGCVCKSARDSETSGIVMCAARYYVEQTELIPRVYWW
jgi:hypothetical protein